MGWSSQGTQFFRHHTRKQAKQEERGGILEQRGEKKIRWKSSLDWEVDRRLEKLLEDAGYAKTWQG